MTEVPMLFALIFYLQIPAKDAILIIMNVREFFIHVKNIRRILFKSIIIYNKNDYRYYSYKCVKEGEFCKTKRKEFIDEEEEYNKIVL